MTNSLTDGTGLKPASFASNCGVGLTPRNVADGYHSQLPRVLSLWPKVVIKKLNAIQDLYRHPLYG